MINIKVNSTDHHFNPDSSIESILNQLEIATNGIALAVNLNIIARVNWRTHALKDGDEVLIIKATQGG